LEDVLLTNASGYKGGAALLSPWMDQYFPKIWAWMSANVAVSVAAA